MELKVRVEDLRKNKLFVATPMFAGVCNGAYTRSLCDLSVLCARYGIEMRSYFLFNESLITRARNYCVDEFLRSEFTHLMFIDSDIGFNPNDVLALMALQTDESDFDIISGAYPKKCITWEKIKTAVNKGFADENPNTLEQFVGDFVFNPVRGSTIKINEPAEVSETGTGFMMIRRKTFEQFAEKFPETLYLPDHVRSENFDGSRKINMFFQAEIEKESGRYLSEDYWFCFKCRQIGMKVWIAPWMHLQHSGYYTFAGNLPAMAALGVSATCDPEEISKTKKKK
jgi:hypothetical protein